jgi:hypothetical protein
VSARIPERHQDGGDWRECDREPLGNTFDPATDGDS